MGAAPRFEIENTKLGAFQKYKSRGEKGAFYWHILVFILGGCNFESIREMFEKDQRALMDAGHLYPAQMTAAALKPKAPNVIHNGGWGDLRDVFMCRSISKNALHIDMSFLDHLTYTWPHMTHFSLPYPNNLYPHNENRTGSKGVKNEKKQSSHNTDS